MVHFVIQWNLPDQKANLTIYANKAKNDWLPTTLAHKGVIEIRNYRNPVGSDAARRHYHRLRDAGQLARLHRFPRLYPHHARVAHPRLQQLHRQRLGAVEIFSRIDEAVEIGRVFFNFLSVARVLVETDQDYLDIS